MRQYVKDGTTPSLLRHSFSLEILEFNRLTSQLGPFLDKTGCRTPPPIITGRTRLFPTLNSNCSRGVDSRAKGPRVGCESPVSEFCLRQTKGFPSWPPRKYTPRVITTLRNQAPYSPHSRDQLVTLLPRTFLISDLGLWATPNHDCFQMWKFDSLALVVLSHQPAHPHHYSERQNIRGSWRN